MSDLQEKSASESSTAPTSAQPQKETVSSGKRLLLKYGWSAPLIVAVSLPKSGFAANISGHSATDGGKVKSKGIISTILGIFGL
jgi:hypothetical protein